MQSVLKRTLLNAATAPYQALGTTHYQWARGKLGHDPIFPAILDLGLIRDGASIMDIGCGRGLLGAWVLAAESLAKQGAWTGPTPPPQHTRFSGVELMGREAECGNLALQPIYGDRVQLSAGDMRQAPMPEVDMVTMLDVLHYVPYEDQEQLLDRIRGALGPGGIFLTRIGDASAGWPFRVSQWVDRCISFVQGHRLNRMWCRSLHDWIDTLRHRGFDVSTQSMSEGTPFANVMLVARVPQRQP